METIKKRADELQPGDIITSPDGALRRAVVAVELGPQMGALARIATVRLEEMPPQMRVDENYKTELLPVEVREAALTPAQQHAEELVEFVRAVMGLSVGDTERNARALLDKIDPPAPPTLAEALALLAEIEQDQWTGAGSRHKLMQQARAYLERARRAGLL